MPTPTTTPALDWRDRGVIINSGPDDGRSANDGDKVVKNGDVLSRSGGDLVAAERADAAAAAAAAAAPNNNNNGRIGGKKTKKRAVRRKRTYKKSKKSYKKSKKLYKNKRSVKRGGETDQTKTFTIVKGNSDDPVFEVELNPDQTGKDLYDRVNEQLDRNLAYYLSDAERAGQRKLVTDNGVIVEYADNLSMFQPRTKLILSIIPERSRNEHGRGQGPDPLHPQDTA